MDLYKNGHFCSFFFVDNMGQENDIYNILERKKTPIWGKKSKSLKSQKIDNFSKGLTHGFGPKEAIFSTFFLGSIGQENRFYGILEQKNAFLGYKNKKFKKSKIAIFLKGLSHGFWTKMAIFPTSCC